MINYAVPSLGVKPLLCDQIFFVKFHVSNVFGPCELGMFDKFGESSYTYYLLVLYILILYILFILAIYILAIYILILYVLILCILLYYPTEEFIYPCRAHMDNSF